MLCPKTAVKYGYHGYFVNNVKTFHRLIWWRFGGSERKSNPTISQQLVENVNTCLQKMLKQIEVKLATFLLTAWWNKTIEQIGCKNCKINMLNTLEIMPLSAVILPGSREWQSHKRIYLNDSSDVTSAKGLEKQVEDRSNTTFSVKDGTSIEWSVLWAMRVCGQI